MTPAGLIDGMFADEGRWGVTYAALVVHRGEVVAERYGGGLPHFDRPPTPVDVDTPLLSWSMAKSITHAAVGIAVGRGLLDVDAPAPVVEWSAPGDPRRAITLEHLLTMRDGLDYCEDYVDDRVSNVIEMLFGSGAGDVAGYAAARPLAHEPGAVFNYSSGTTNIITRILGDALGGEGAMRAFLHDELFGPLGMTTADPRFDAAGTFIGSSYVYATARDFAKFGALYLDDGCVGERRVLPEGWVAHGIRERSVDVDGSGYGAQWWLRRDDLGSFFASGYEGQMILVVPPLDLVVVRLGRSDAEQKLRLDGWRQSMIDAFR